MNLELWVIFFPKKLAFCLMFSAKHSNIIIINFIFFFLFFFTEKNWGNHFRGMRMFDLKLIILLI